MAWKEERKSGWVVRERVRGKAVSEYFTDEHEADEKLRQLNAKRDLAKHVAGLDPTSAAAIFLGDWDRAPEAEDPQYAFETYCRRMVAADKELRDSTRELYERNVKNHIGGTALGRADIRRVSPEILDEYWAGLDLGVGALRNVQQLLSKAFKRALRAGLIDTNPLDRSDVRRPSKERREEVVPLTVDELKSLAASAKYSRDRLEILVMGTGGLRAGEVAGLRVQDIDFDRCQLSLRQQVVRVTGKGMYVSPLKTNAARRTVTLPCSVTDELRAFVAADPPADDGRIFHGANGEMRAHTSINHGVQMAAKRAGLAGVHAHQLRHTAVSLLIQAGANPKAIQQFVGHSDIRMTLGTYGHLFDYGGQDLADKMERMLNGGDES